MRLLRPPADFAVRDYSSALRSMVDRAYAKSRRHRFEVASTDWTGVHPLLRLFAVKFERHMRKRYSVPIRITRADDAYEVEIRHSRMGELHALAWGLLGHSGNSVSVQYSLGVRWAGQDRPAHWVLHEELVPAFRWRELEALGFGLGLG